MSSDRQRALVHGRKRVGRKMANDGQRGFPIRFVSALKLNVSVL